MLEKMNVAPFKKYCCIAEHLNIIFHTKHKQTKKKKVKMPATVQVKTGIPEL